jgi:hypothetical protein
MTLSNHGSTIENIFINQDFAFLKLGFLVRILYMKDITVYPNDQLLLIAIVALGLHAILVC